MMSFVYFIYLLSYLFIIFITYTRICAGAFLQTTGTEEKRRRRPSRLKSLRGLAFQNDAAIATTQSPLQKKKKKKTSRLFWSRWMTATDGCRRKINGYVNEKWGIKGVVQSIYDDTKAYCRYERAQAVQNSSYIMCREQCPISAGLLDKHIGNERESIYTFF